MRILSRFHSLSEDRYVSWISAGFCLQEVEERIRIPTTGTIRFFVFHVNWLKYVTNIIYF